MIYSRFRNRLPLWDTSSTSVQLARYLTVVSELASPHLAGPRQVLALTLFIKYQYRLKFSIRDPSNSDTMACCIPVLVCYYTCLNWLKRILHIDEKITLQYIPKQDTRPAQKRRFKWDFHTTDHYIQRRKDKNGHTVYRCTFCRQPEYLTEELVLKHREIHFEPRSM
jgi:hypothetical protein